MKVRYNAQSDLGLKREVNQDCYGIVVSLNPEQQGDLLVVCDGMGGHFAGEVASRIGVNVFLAHYYASDQADRSESMKQALIAANRQIYQQGRGTMGTTGVAALLFNGQLHIANVGDSRAYLVRNKLITQLSQDHSFVAEQVAAGLLTPEQARMSVHRNMITRALGHQSDVQVDLFAPITVHPGDSIILSTDGLHALVEDSEIADFVSRLPLEQAVPQLVELANARGGTDNITVVVAQIMAEADDTPSASDEGTAITLPLPELATAPPALAPPAAATGPGTSPAAARRGWTPMRVGLAVATVLLLAVGILAFAFPAVGIIPDPLSGLAVSTATLTSTPTGTATGTPTVTATITPTVAATHTPTVIATVAVTGTPTVIPTAAAETTSSP